MSAQPHQYELAQEIKDILQALAEQITENTCNRKRRRRQMTDEAKRLLTAVSQRLTEQVIIRVERDLWAMAAQLMQENERLQDENNSYRALYGPIVSLSGTSQSVGKATVQRRDN